MIIAVTKMDPQDIQTSPFKSPTEREFGKHMALCGLVNTGSYYYLPQLNQAILNEACTQPGTYDYIYNSEVAYILTFIGIGTFAIGNIIFKWFFSSIHNNNSVKIPLIQRRLNFFFF